MDKTKIIITSIIGVVIVIGAWLIATGFKNFREGEPNINVTGMAEKQITSDLIVWKISVNAEGSTRSSAFTEFEKAARVMRQYLQTHGIPEKEITLSSVDINKRTKDFWDEDSRKYVTLENGYAVSQKITVSSNDIKRVESVYQRISELYNSGMDFSS